MGVTYEELTQDWGAARRGIEIRNRRDRVRAGIQLEGELLPYQTGMLQALVRRETLTLGVDLGMVQRTPFVEAMTNQLAPGQPDLDALEGILTRLDTGADRPLPIPSGVPLIEFMRVMEEVGDRQEAFELIERRHRVDAGHGVITACYGEPASLGMPYRTGATTVTFTAPAIYSAVPDGLPRHLRDAPHYRQIENRGGRRPMA